MNTTEFQAARQRLGRTDEELATALGVSTDVAQAWGTGRLAIPREYAQHIIWLRDEPEREAALRASGLPECDWLRARHAERPPPGLAAVLQSVKKIKRHVQTCPRCVAREQFVSEHFGPAPSVPMPWWARFVVWASRLAL